MVPGKARKAQPIPSAAAETDGEKGTGHAVHFGFLKARHKRGREALQPSRGTQCAMFPKRR